MILVTRAAGRLGRRVVQLLLDKGREVRGTDRVPHDDPATLFVRTDRCDAEAARGLLEGIEAVVHLGAIPGPGPEGQPDFPLPPPPPANLTTLVMWAYADPRDVAEAHGLAFEADLEDNASVINTEEARRMLDFRPRHGWHRAGG